MGVKPQNPGGQRNAFWQDAASLWEKCFGGTKRNPHPLAVIGNEPSQPGLRLPRASQAAANQLLKPMSAQTPVPDNTPKKPMGWLVGLGVLLITLGVAAGLVGILVVSKNKQKHRIPTTELPPTTNASSHAPVN